ncbi:MAG: hypothetical protein ACRDF4_09285, partial [Rhabdochlamydiaceae bacterium]
MAIDYVSVSAGLTATLVVCAAIFFGSKKLISQSKLSQSVQFVFVRILQGPVIVAIAGYGLLASIEYSLSPQTAAELPFYVKPPGLKLVLELVILAAAVRTAGSIVRQLVPALTKAKEADRILVYSVYTLGLIALAYIVLTSSISPAVATNVWALVNFMTGIFITYLAVYVVNVVFKRYSAAIESKEAGLRTTITFVRRLALSIVALIGVAAATFASFPEIGGVIASLFIAAGFASIVIGLAAQASLSN